MIYGECLTEQSMNEQDFTMNLLIENVNMNTQLALYCLNEADSATSKKGIISRIKDIFDKFIKWVTKTTKDIKDKIKSFFIKKKSEEAKNKQSTPKSGKVEIWDIYNRYRNIDLDSITEIPELGVSDDMIAGFASFDINMFEEEMLSSFSDELGIKINSIDDIKNADIIERKEIEYDESKIRDTIKNLEQHLNMIETAKNSARDITNNIINNINKNTDNHRNDSEYIKGINNSIRYYNLISKLIYATCDLIFNSIGKCISHNTSVL